jgi:hypothetical protein
LEEINMKTASLLAVALISFASVSLMAQQASATAQQSTSADGNGTHVNGSSSTSGNAQVNRQGAQVSGSGSSSASSSARGVGAASGSGGAGMEMRPVNTELVGKLDSKSAKAGDPVVVKTTEATRTADGTVIPKGTRLMGHVTSVQAHEKGNAESHMAIAFDRAEMKGGQSLPIHSEIRSVAPSASAMAMNSAQSDDSLAGGGLGGGRAMGGARTGGAVGGGGLGGGGLVGGGAVSSVAGGTVRGAANTTGQLGSGVGATAGDTVRASGNVVGGATSGVGMAAGAAGGVAAHATALPGVMLAGDATGSASGTLSATKQNVHLESGTQMVLGVAAAR